jgi:hypothetical protein
MLRSCRSTFGTLGVETLNRAELQQLSRARIDDTAALLAARRWQAAYYLTGYALECALKSCILSRIERTGIIFEDKRFVENCWTHDLEKLVVQSDLVVEFGLARSAQPELDANWLIAIDWSVESRYQLSSQAQATQLLEAISNPINGVLVWFRNFW